METRSFGIKLRELRQQAGLSQRELAGKVGVNFTYLSKIESGVLPPPSEKVILKLGEVLDADTDELMTLAGKIPPDIAQILKNREALRLLRSSHIQKKSSMNKKEGVGIMKSLMSYKGFARVALAVFLVAATATSLWFASPSPVRALNISFPSLPSTGTLGRTFSFQVKVDVQSMDILPVVRIDLEIRNAASPSTYLATLAELPLNAGSKSYTSAQTGGGDVSVTATTATGWGFGSSGSRRGYGYRDPAGWGYHDPLGGLFGYGYSSGGVQGNTSITYNITWTPPAAWPQGAYNTKALVYGDGANKFSGTSASFNLSTPSGDGGETIGAGIVIESPGVVNVSNVVTNAGVFTTSVTAQSADAKVTLQINYGTIGKNKDGTPVSRISAAVMPTPPTPPADASILGLAYELGPNEATFSPPISLTFAYDPAKIATGVSEKDLSIAWWNKTTGKWEIITGATVNTQNHTITGLVGHYTPFAVLAPLAPPTPAPVVKPAAFTTSGLSISPSQVNSGESVTISVQVANTGDVSGGYKVTLKVNGVAEATKDIVVTGGVTQKVTFTIAKNVAGTYTVTIDNLSSSFTVKAPTKPAAFTSSSLAITPAQANTGESVTISIQVANTGDLSGSYKVTLKVNDAVEATKDVTVASGAKQTVTFTTTKNTAGTYTVNVNGLSGTFTVKTPVVPPTPIKWWLFAIIAGVIVIGLAIWLVRRRMY